MLCLIAAVAANNCIGRGNEMPWHLSPDLKRFKELTYGKTVIMGSKTFLSLKKPLKGRRHIVLTRNSQKYRAMDDVTYCNDADKVFMECQASEDEFFVIGGGEVYKKAMPYCDKLYITEILESFDGDTFFPKIDNGIFRRAELSGVMADEAGGLKYRYVIYEKTR